MHDMQESTSWNEAGGFDDLMRSLKARVNRQQWDTWFASAALESWKDGALVIALPNRFYQEWFQNRFHSLITQAAQEVRGAPTDVRFELAAPGAEPKGPAMPTVQLEPGPEEMTAAPHVSPTPPPSKTEPPLPPTARRPEPFSGSGPEDLPLRLNEFYTFRNFITGPSNSVAHASARGVAQEPGRAYNPLFIHGPVGLGKTHLLHAICREYLERCPRDRVCLMSCEEFTNEFVHAVQHNDVESFRERFRSVHLLVIDDIHFLKGKERTQEEFFHNLQPASTSPTGRSCSPPMPRRTRSRRWKTASSRASHWGLVTQLEQPEMETRMAIVRRKAELHDIPVANDVVEYIAQHFRNNIRELEGALLSVKARAEVARQPIDLALAEAALEASLRNGRPAVTLDRITQLICTQHQVKVSELRSKRRGRSISEPRQLVMYLARRLTNLSLDEIGDHFGGRDHSTVLYAVRKVQKRVESDPTFASTVDRLEDRLGGPPRES